MNSFFPILPFRLYQRRSTNGFPPIEKVSLTMTKLDKDSYTPILVSLGPYHRNNPEIQIPTVAKAKADAMDLILRKHNMCVEDLSGMMSEVFGMTSNCWDLKSRLSEEELFLLVLQDSCFVICILECAKNNFKLDVPFCITGYQFDTGSIIRDLVLMENQIPFRFVKELYGILAVNGDVSVANDLAKKFVESLLKEYGNSVNLNNKPLEFEHLLHLTHLYLEPNLSQINGTDATNRSEKFFQFVTSIIKGDKKEKLGEPEIRFFTWKPAEVYYNNGITFKKKRGNNHSILDVEFRNGVVTIPFITLDKLMCPLLKNLVAFEDSRDDEGEGEYVTSYVCMLTRLLTPSKDVDILVKNGILENRLNNSEEICELFRNMFFWFPMFSSSQEEFYLKDVMCEMDLFMDKWYTKARVEIWKFVTNTRAVLNYICGMWF